MSGFKKGFLVGVGAVFGVWTLGAIITVALVTGGARGPRVESRSTLVVVLSGDIPEYVDFDMPGFMSGMDDDPVTLLNYVRAIRAAADDDRIEALVLRCDGSASGWAKAQELRWAVQEFKKSGKPVWAFLEVASREDYYIASLADRVVIQPKSFLNLSGLRMEVTFFKGAMDKLGVEADLIRSGRYKSAGEPFSRAEMSPEWRHVLNETLDEFYRQLLSGIAEGRGEDSAHWRAVIDRGPFTADEARASGLADEILFEDEFYEQLAEGTGDEEKLNRVPLSVYARSALSKEPAGGSVFALVHASGAIYSGIESPDPFGLASGTLASRSFIRRLNELREDESVDGVLLRIDSPGGDAIASEQILRAVRRLASDKPTVVSMSNVAASGGYYIAAVPDVPILVYPGTYTGSIGVFTLSLNLRSLYDKLGITKEILTRGQNAAIETDYRALSDSERAKLRHYVDEIYDTFLRRVAEGRGTDTDWVSGLAEGRVWVGAQAVSNGLVDGIGGYLDAIERLKQVAGLEDGERVRIVPYPRERSIFEAFFSSGPMAVARQVTLPPVLTRLGEPWIGARHWVGNLRNGPAYIAPFHLAVQ